MAIIQLKSLHCLVELTPSNGGLKVFVDLAGAGKVIPGIAQAGRSQVTKFAHYTSEKEAFPFPSLPAFLLRPRLARSLFFRGSRPGTAIGVRPQSKRASFAALHSSKFFHWTCNGICGLNFL